TIDEMLSIFHHMIDVVEPNDSFSVAKFKKIAEETIDDIIKRSKYPIIVGGTSLYINSLIFNYEFSITYKYAEYRKYLQDIADEKGKDYVHEMLKQVDSASYERLHVNDLKRVIRALEVYKITGKTIGELNKEQDIYDIPYNIHYYVLNMDRGKLYEKINNRVDVMINSGLVDEVIKLKEKGYNSNMQSMKGIGYKEILYYLNGDITLEEAIDMIKQGSRNYAKRQLTWFRKDKRAVWINKDNFKDNDAIVDFILNNVNIKSTIH
ncbi:MAG: tRNA (adenosine(37)-N6)-dimethylallyltransferase MiaA, partial [Clostridium sp.]|nr:tRNA (adenosine(37)-N6)-dimethylallyltransferase MiaA [Clostridium sp.]